MHFMCVLILINGNVTSQIDDSISDIQWLVLNLLVAPIFLMYPKGHFCFREYSNVDNLTPTYIKKCLGMLDLKPVGLVKDQRDQRRRCSES